MKNLGITSAAKAKENIRDVILFGDGDTWLLLCKASSEEQGWMKSTKVMNVPGGCVVQVTTQQRSDAGSTPNTYAVAEALTFVPGVHIVNDGHPDNPRKLVVIT